MFYMIMIMPRLEKKPVPKPEPMLKPYSSLRLGSMRVESVPVLKPSQFPYAPPHAARQYSDSGDLSNGAPIGCPDYTAYSFPTSNFIEPYRHEPTPYLSAGGGDFGGGGASSSWEPSSSSCTSSDSSSSSSGDSGSSCSSSD